ncbi:uncharacterized protein BDR25DRAFT_358234 [Lindgomyces ingoldianus]|uniref:Uncharacterized protein n=1 Tax=Lindgomyces ingoldianus TaxID=673940 RepID=A0ACB6QPD9_9PLEO|nr:uncharacterized protein BDR25DRAFT_358234 [Lindgomyces ingoldianus]KAF2467975.1 hypothetical protein BDR25DRAFT_358234 [Lindgomyces ingoldianus]
MQLEEGRSVENSSQDPDYRMMRKCCSSGRLLVVLGNATTSPERTEAQNFSLDNHGMSILNALLRSHVSQKILGTESQGNTNLRVVARSGRAVFDDVRARSVGIAVQPLSSRKESWAPILGCRVLIQFPIHRFGRDDSGDCYGHVKARTGIEHTKKLVNFFPAPTFQLPLAFEQICSSYLGEKREFSCPIEEALFNQIDTIHKMNSIFQCSTKLTLKERKDKTTPTMNSTAFSTLAVQHHSVSSSSKHQDPSTAQLAPTLGAEAASERHVVPSKAYRTR